jgi:hypothetical protein
VPRQGREPEDEIAAAGASGEVRRAEDPGRDHEPDAIGEQEALDAGAGRRHGEGALAPREHDELGIRRHDQHALATLEPGLEVADRAIEVERRDGDAENVERSLTRRHFESVPRSARSRRGGDRGAARTR